MTILKSPLDLHCRGCDAQPGEKCGVVPNRSWLRRQLRRGDPVHPYYIRLIPYFHAMRWRDFNRVRNEYAKLAEWQKRYGGKSEAA